MLVCVYAVTERVLMLVSDRDKASEGGRFGCSRTNRNVTDCTGKSGFQEGY